ncbi:MAG: peptidyl-prolyl cis-trans isomerase [Planctomycetes bacterium]|nr:peptidyl-prolyl cis-trans isomerase [Planctomycetota bacterium]
MRFAIGILLAVGAASAQDSPRRVYSDSIVAVVDGDPITHRELLMACRLTPDYPQLPEGGEGRAQIERNLLKILVEERVLLHRAQREGVVLSPEDERRLVVELGRQAEQYGGEGGLRNALREFGVSLDYFRARQRNQLVMRRLLGKNVSTEAYVPPGEMQRYYAEHRARYEVRPETRVWQIVVFPGAAQCLREPTPELAAALADPSWEPADFAERARARVAAGESFPDVARETSMMSGFEKPVVLKGKTTPQDVFNPPLDAAVDSLDAGELSEVLVDDKGTRYLVWIELKRRGGMRPLSEVQDEIHDTLRQALYERKVADWTRQLTQEAVIEVYLEGVEIR